MSGLAKVTIEKKNGALGGITPSNDGESLLIIATYGIYAISNSGQNAQTSIEANELFQSFTGYDDFLLNYADYDTEHGILFQHHVEKFFLASSSKLHVMHVNLTTTFDNLFTVGSSLYTALKGYLQQQNGAIKLIGVALNPNFVETKANGVATSLSSDITKAQALVDSEFVAGRPVHLFLEGRGVDLTHNTLFNLRTKSAPGVSVVAFQKNDIPTAIPSTVSITNATYTFLVNVANYADVGYVLGLCSAIPVQRNIGRVKNGALAYTDNLASSSGQLITDLNQVVIDSVVDKGYIIAVKHPQLSGFYLSDDPTCTAITDDYAWISRNRTVNKAATITRRVFAENMLDEVYVDPDTGKLSVLTIKNFEAQVESAIDLEMVRAGEITAIEAYVNPEQDVLTTNEIVVELRIVSVGVARYIVAKIGFSKVI